MNEALILFVSFPTLLVCAYALGWLNEFERCRRQRDDARQLSWDQ